MTKTTLKDDFVRDAYIYDVHDGDTVYYHADLGYFTWAAFQTGRLLDIDTPEVRPLKTRDEGLAAKFLLLTLLREYALNRDNEADTQRLGFKVRIRSVPCDNKWFNDLAGPDKGKYGRWLIELFGVDDVGEVVNLNELMKRHGYAIKEK